MPREPPGHPTSSHGSEDTTGQTTTITITHAPELTAEHLEEIANGHVYDTIPLTDDNGTHHLQGNSKWSPEEFISAVVSLTADQPAATMTVNEEWDNRDADEPGQTISRYRAGELITGERATRCDEPLPPQHLMDGQGANVCRVQRAPRCDGGR